MAEPFKELINPKTVGALADELSNADPDFDRDGFVTKATDGLAALELKDRVRHVAKTVRDHLPNDWNDALDLMLAAMAPPQQNDQEVTGGVRYWPLLQVVEDEGVCDVQASLAAIKQMTQRFSAEFAIRPLIKADAEAVIAELQQWASHESLHVRRLVSEGTRPRLPWGMRLQGFIDRPESTLPLLEVLKDDAEEYVQRSVANHLNDIAKDHPELVVKVAERWWSNGDARRRKLIRHALRTLLKDGNGGALAVLGFKRPIIECGELRLSREIVPYGESLELSIDLESNSEDEQQLMVDYAIVFPRKKGKTSRKVFKGGKRKLAAGSKWSFTKRHALKKVTTRKHYSGRHRIEVLVNGLCVAEGGFELVGGDEA